MKYIDLFRIDLLLVTTKSWYQISKGIDTPVSRRKPRDLLEFGNAGKNQVDFKKFGGNKIGSAPSVPTFGHLVVALVSSGSQAHSISGMVGSFFSCVHVDSISLSTQNNRMIFYDILLVYMNEEKKKNMRMPDKLSGAIEKASKVLSPVFLSFVLAPTMAGCNGGGRWHGFGKWTRRCYIWTTSNWGSAQSPHQWVSKIFTKFSNAMRIVNCCN